MVMMTTICQPVSRLQLKTILLLIILEKNKKKIKIIKMNMEGDGVFSDGF